MLQVRENEISLRKWSDGTAHLRTFRALVAKNALCWQQCFFTHTVVWTRDGQTCSTDDSFAENQKHQWADKLVCCVNTNRLGERIQVLHYMLYSSCQY